MTSLTRVDPVSFWPPGGEYRPETFFFVATPNDVTDAGRSGEVLAAQWGIPSGDIFLRQPLMTSLTRVDPVSFWSPGGEYHPETFFFMATPNDVTDAGRSGEFLVAQWGIPSGDIFSWQPGFCPYVLHFSCSTGFLLLFFGQTAP